MKSSNRTWIIILLLVTALLQIQNAVSQVSIERLKLPSTSDSITRILEDEVTGRVIRIFTKLDKTHQTKHTYVKGVPSIQSGFILENGQKIELPRNETVECLRNNFIITSNGDVIEYKTVFTLCKIEESNGILNLRIIDTIISNGDYSVAAFLNTDRIIIQEFQEGGVETLIQLYDFNLNLLSQIKPYSNRNVSGSSYALKDNKLYYSIEPDQYDEYGLPLPKILIIDILKGNIIKEKNIENFEHGLEISICENRLLGNYYETIFGYDMELNLLWKISGLVPSVYTFINGDNILMILYNASTNIITGLNIKDGNIVWQKSISDFLQSETVGCTFDKDYTMRIYEMKQYEGQKTIILIAGGYLSNLKRMTEKPLICNPETIILDYSGSILSNSPIDFNEFSPLLFSNHENENIITINTIHESVKLNVHENK
jgi:hypothetical protein